MKVQDILPKMSKMYLNRILDSFMKDVKLNDEEEMRDVISRNIEEFQNKERVKRNLDFSEEKRDVFLINEMILMALMDTEGYLLTEAEVIQQVEQLEKQIVEESMDEEYVKNVIDPDHYRIYSNVLKAAWKKDESLNAHEINMLTVLREELGLTKRDHYLIESQIGRFPQKGNKPHSLKQIENSLKHLQLRGLILRFKEDDIYYIIPKDIARTIRYELGGELRQSTYEMLLQDLSKNQLKEILTQMDLPGSGTKPALIDRILRHHILPSSALNSLPNGDLKEILKSLEGINISGTKSERISNIIDYYEDLSTQEVSDPTDERALYFDYIEDLASRNYNPLRVNKVIDKDNEIEKYFEQATHYAVEKKLGLKPVAMKGSKHSDGKLSFGSNESVLWDNKSMEESYTFPNDHFDQFLGYIRANDNRVTLFLIITSDISPEAVSQAQRLKALSETDSDVALIRAEDFKYVCDNWKEYSSKKIPEFSLQVFNYTGELNRQTLTDRMKWAVE
ncbi:SAP domain-containing protein [Alkalicoccus chagannorensis]|uniref:SAP domain-containing protein n=1 Tax=Alkalicoccus chagannorensis TaxID=427072 RepID=UPI00040B6B45|nr:SAP domain-containing protein [Alkalicoccus chagannorensis]